MKETQKDKVLKILRRDGEIKNFDAINGTHGFICLRLGDVIFRLRADGHEIESQGYEEDSKNWKYVIKDKPKSIEVYTVKGGNPDGSDKIIKKVIW